MREPLLAHKRLPPSDGYKVPRVFKVYGGLRKLGSQSPYFSITAWAHRAGFPSQCQSGGAAHDEIERHFPGRFTDLIALHLCDENGAPMHAEANGWYYLDACLTKPFGKYHAGNAEKHFPREAPADKPWQTTEYRKPTLEECDMLFAEFCRMPLSEARRIIDLANSATLPNAWGQDAKCEKASRDVWKAELEKMRPRWKAEAGACREKFGLIVFGDV